MEQSRIKEMQERLTMLKAQDITEIRPENLRELQDISIDPELPVGERLMSLIEQAGNPYAYLNNGIVVKISFSESGRSLQECMEEYLMSEMLPDLK